MLKILVVDDEPHVRKFIAELLCESYEIFEASTGLEGLQQAIVQKPNLILLDLLLPDISGIQISKKLREDARTHGIPVIMLTAMNQSEQRIAAFESGIDDYFAKPFHPRELLARVGAKLTRTSEFKLAGRNDAMNLRIGKLEIDFAEMKVIVGGKDLHLAGVEFKLASFLARHHGALVPRVDLENFVWGDSKPSQRALDPHIASLRRKLKSTGMVDLRTSYRTGFALKVESETES